MSTEIDFPFLHDVYSSEGSNFNTFFAATIPSIPDLSSFEEFVNVDRIEQLKRVINAMRLLLLGLNSQTQDGQRAFEIRYIWNNQKLTLAFLGKGTGKKREDARSACLGLWNDLIKLFPYTYYRGGIRPALTPEDFVALYQPFPFNSSQIVALRKDIEIRPLLRSEVTYPIIHPYKWGISAMTEFCKTLTRQDSPCYVSLALFPAGRNFDETKAMNILAGSLKKAGEGKDRSLRMGLSSTQASSSSQVTHRDNFGQSLRENFSPDPQAQFAAEIYEDSIHRSGRPLIFRPYIVSSQSVAPNIIGALQLEMVGYVPDSSDATRQTPLPHLPEEIRFSDGSLESARKDLERMSFDALVREPCSLTSIEGEFHGLASNLARLPYLVDIDEAICAFRFPVLLQRDEIGLDIHSGAFVALRQETGSDRARITIGLQSDLQPYTVTISDINRHVLIAGTTGSGKTTACLHLLSQLNRQNIPFLIIEPINAEHNDYRSLLRLPNLDESMIIFTLGDESVSPFRLNPFEIQPGITVSEHISALLTAFKAAIPMWEPLPRIFLKALNRVYFKFGWIPSAKPTGMDDDPPFPTLQDFYSEISYVVDFEIEHEGEVKGNIRGASKLRIESLIEGSCGRILSARHSIPVDLWMRLPVIFELRHLGDDEDKALMMAFLLMTINEYLEKGRLLPEKETLQHVLVIEEAHRLLENIQGDSNPEQTNTRGQAAQAFAHALAENRKYGEGVIILEQMPTKLVPDAIGNTGLKLMFRLTAADDRDTAGKSMNLNEFQQEYVTGLRAGQAAILGNQFDEPVLVQTTNYWDDWEKRGCHVASQPVNDKEVADRMGWIRRQWGAYFVPFDGCKLCNAICQFRDFSEGLMHNRELGLMDAFLKICSDETLKGDSQLWMENLVDFSNQAITEYSPVKFSQVDHDEASYCLFLHLKETSKIFPKVPMIVEASFRKMQIAKKGE